MAEAARNADEQICEKDGDNANNLQEDPLSLKAATTKPASVRLKPQCEVLKDVFHESIKEQDYFAMSNDGLEKDFETTPPSPPPPTPVAAKLLNNDKAAVCIGENSIHEHSLDDDDSAFEKWEDPSAPPPPPPLPACRFLSNGFNYFNAKKLKDALEEAIIKLETKQEPKENESRRVLDNIDNCLRTDKLEMSDVQNKEPCVNKSSKESLILTPSTATSKAIVVHPKNSKPEAILLIERTIKINKLMEKQNQTHSPIVKDAIPMPAPNGNDVDMHKDDLSLKVMANPFMRVNLNAQQSNANTQQSDDEVHLLQALPARSSTPYTLGLVSGTDVGVDLEHTVEEKFPLSVIDEQKHHQQQLKKRDFLAPDSKSSWESSEVSKLPGSSAQNRKLLHYNRANMLEIRNDMINAFNACSQELVPFMPRIATCDDIELEARLRRLNLWRMVDNKHATRTTEKFKLRQTADCNPHHFKSRNKTQVLMDDSIIKSEPPQPNLKENTMVYIPRRIGSGRLHQSKWSHNANYNKSYHQPTSAVKQHDNDDVSTSCLLQSDGNFNISSGKMNTYQSRPTSTTQPLSTSSIRFKDSEKSNEINSSLNENYVKRVMSGFLFVSNPKSRETEEKYNRRYRNQSEEPEWFSSGPTSRLDTIELCGFDDDKEPLNTLTENGENTNSNLHIQENSNIPCKWQSNLMVDNHKVITKNIAKTNFEENKTNYIPQMKVHSENIVSQQQMQDDKLPKRTVLYDQFENSSTDFNSKLLQQPPRQNCQLNYPRSTGGDDTASFNHEQLSNSSSKFMSFFEAKRASSSASLNDKSDKGGGPSKTLNKFFKHAGNLQHNQAADQFGTSTVTMQQQQTNLLPQMPSVDQLEAKWRKNSLISCSNETDRNNNKGNHLESFQKLIGALNTCSQSGAPGGSLNAGVNVMERQQQKQTIAQHQLSPNGSTNLNNYALNNIVLQQQQFQQQQQKQQMLIQQQQKHASLLASLQLKSILSRADTQVLLLRLAKGEISKHGLLVQLANPHLPSHDRDTITAVLQFTNTQQQQQHHQQQLEILSNNLITNQLQNLHNLSVIQQSLARQQQQIHWNQKQYQQQQISQEDLQTRTNLIMQNAVLKRKFKEESSKLLQFNATAPVVKSQQYSNTTFTGGQLQQDGPTSHSGHAVSTFVQQLDNNRNVMHSQYHPEVVNNMNADEGLNKFAADINQQQWTPSYFNFKPSRQQQSQKYIANNKPCHIQKLAK